MTADQDQEKEKEDEYIDTRHALRKDFVPLVYSDNGMMAGKEARAAEAVGFFLLWLKMEVTILSDGAVCENGDKYRQWCNQTL